MPKQELTPQQHDALDLLVGGPKIPDYQWDERTAASSPRYLDIPRTLQLPENDGLDHTLDNIRASVLESCQPGEYPLTPTYDSHFRREMDEPGLESADYYLYIDLTNQGLVSMETPQGCKVTKIEITPKGAQVLGKKLVPRDERIHLTNILLFWSDKQ